MDAAMYKLNVDATVYYPDGTTKELHGPLFHRHDLIRELLFPESMREDAEFTMLNIHNPGWRITFNGETKSKGICYAGCDIRTLAKTNPAHPWLQKNKNVTYPTNTGVGPEWYEVWGPVLYVHEDEPEDIDELLETVDQDSLDSMNYVFYV